jgi:hypothetical protein
MDAEKTLLSLDMSTTCTGYSVFGIDSKKLLTTGKLKPKTSGAVAKMVYPRQQLTKMIDLAHQILAVIEQVKPQVIVIEEIAGSKNRLGQKTLDGFHFVVVWVIEQYLDVVRYYDVTGSSGWRTHLQLRLDDSDKAANKEAKVLNKKLRGCQKIPIIGPKHLAARHVNKKFGLCLNVDTCETDADVADSVAMGDAFLTFRFAEIPR